MIEINKKASEPKTAIDEEFKKDTSEPSKKNSGGTKDSAALNKTLIATSLVISLIALGAAGWLFYQSEQNNTQAKLAALKNQQDNFNSELNAHNNTYNQLTKLSDQVAKSEQNTKQQTRSLQAQQTTQQNQLISLENRMRQINSASKEDWKLAEVEYLVRLANQRLLLESDLNGAEALLSNADSILAELQDPLFFDARKAIARDIQALKSTTHFDVEGRYLQLGALYDQVSQLPQREPSEKWLEANKKEQQSKLKQTTAEVSSTLAKIWDSIKSLVVINYNHKPIKTLLPPAEYQELVTGLQLQIDVAQVAMVKGETSIYQKALSRVANAITEHFDTRSQSVIAFMTSLTSLQQVNPAPELPLPRDSLNAMKKLMKEWNTRSIPKADSTPDTAPSTLNEPPQESTKQSAKDKVTPLSGESDKKITEDKAAGEQA